MNSFWKKYLALGLILLVLLSFPSPLWADRLANDCNSTTNPSSNPIRGNLGNEVLYYIVVDRFFDGESKNNIPTYSFPLDASQPETATYNKMNQLLVRYTYDPTRSYMGMYWGGDLQGVIAKLDYLKELGVTKIILSPIQDNANGFFYHPNIQSFLHRSAKDETIPDPLYNHISTGYHGYWTKDWFEIDEHFRDPRDESGDRYRVFKQLLDEAGEKGIGVILDLTINQSSPGHISTTPPQLGAGGFLFGDSWFADNGNIYRHGKLVATHWDPRLGIRDPQGWFHKPEIIWDFDTATKRLLEEGQISGGMPDLNQDTPAVEDYLFDAVSFWLTFNQASYPIAGFRLDAVKHINEQFWQKFENLVISINPNAILIGEYFSGGYRNPPSLDFLQETHHITQFDFDLSEAARRFFARDRVWDGRSYILEETSLGCNGRNYRAQGLEKAWRWAMNPAGTLEIPRDSISRISNEETKSWVTFVENHDQPRVRSYYPQMSDLAYASLVKFQFAARGVPLIMYGSETGLGVPYHPKHDGLFGIGGDPFNRPMMIWPNTPGWSPEIYKATQDMTFLRKHYPVLRYGDTQFLHPTSADPKSDIFMLRQYTDCKTGCTEILYAYSTKGGKFLLEFPKIQTYTVLESNQSSTVIDGLLPVSLQPEEAKVLILVRQDGIPTT